MLHVTVTTWIGNAAAVLSGTWGAVTRRAQHRGARRTTVSMPAQRVGHAVASEQAGGLRDDALWRENGLPGKFGVIDVHRGAPRGQPRQNIVSLSAE